MAVSTPRWVVKSGRLSPDEDRLREDYYHEALAFSRHTINLEFDEETMKPEKATEAPEKHRNRSKYPENEAMVPGTRSRERSEGAHWNGQSILSRTGTNLRMTMSGL